MKFYYLFLQESQVHYSCKCPNLRSFSTVNYQNISGNFVVPIEIFMKEKGRVHTNKEKRRVQLISAKTPQSR